jgi:hypothetical protein
MSALQAKMFELSRVNAQLYQLHLRLKREGEAGATPDQLECLRAGLRVLDADVSKLLSEIAHLRAAGPDERGR